MRPVPWKTSDVAFGISLAGVGILVLVVIYRAVSADVESGRGFAILGGTAYGIVLLACWFMGPIRHRTSVGSLGLKPPSPGRYLQPSLLLLVLGASLGFLILYAGLLSLLGWEDLLPRSQADDILLEGPWIIGSFALVVLWGPLAEELFFRGFIFPGLVGWMGVRHAAVASSLLFALFHVDPKVMVPFFAIGMLLAWLYHRTGSLWNCFAAHAIWNGVALSISVWV